jgi:SEC-C motif domain protein
MKTTSLCACGSGTPYKKCCRPLHRGRPAPTPEALMRSRYTAYCLDLPDYIITTTHPGGPHWEPDLHRWRQSIRRFTDSTQFQALEVLAASASGERGEVTFRARLIQRDVDASFTERSTFVRHDGRWKYHSGEQV